MRQMFTMFWILILGNSYGQALKEKNLNTEIREVTVFLKGAQIFETGTVQIPAGTTVLQIKNLSPYIDDRSIKVRGDGDFTILSVNHRLNYLGELKKESTVDSLTKILTGVSLSISREKARLEMLSEKLSVLNANKDLGGLNSGATLTELKQAIDFYENEVLKIKEDEIKTRKVIESREQEQARLSKQLSDVRETGLTPVGEIAIKVHSDNSGIGKFHITYMVSNAGWYPKYDIRVQDIRNPLQLIYKAEVFQNTGVEWKNVKLRFSNGDPSRSGVIPELNQWNLGYMRTYSYNMNAALYGSRSPEGFVTGQVTDESGAPLPGVNVLIKGTSIGTVTDVNGNYSLTLPSGATQIVFSFVGMTSQEVAITGPRVNARLSEDVKQLSETVVVGYGLAGQTSGVRVRGVGTVKKAESKPLYTTITENQTTVEIEVETPYTIQSNGTKLVVDLKQFEIDAAYEYYAIPKLDKDAFLIARIPNWDQYNLLEGEANLYFEDAYVGRSILNAKSLQDTLDISLGRDRNIVIGREKDTEFFKRKAIGSSIVETRGFKIAVRNKKSQSLKLTLFDQVPVSVVDDIVVDPVNLSKGHHDQLTGRITWQLNIAAQQQTELNLQYEVRYPKRERVILE